MIKWYINRGGRYVYAFVKKEISQKNKLERVTYGIEHNYDPLFGFFDHIIYIDKAHVNLTSQAQGRVTRERGKRDNLENIEERPPLKGVRFHIAAWIS
jgi:hypothetical protein